MEMLESQHPVERPRAILHDYQVADGLAIEKISFNWDFYSRLKSDGTAKGWKKAFLDYVRENMELPFRKHAVDPFTCYYEFDIDGLSAVAEYAKVRRSALSEQYAENQSVINQLARIPLNDQAGMGGNTSTTQATNGFEDGADMVTIIEVWTRKEFILIAEGEKDAKTDEKARAVLLRSKHPYGRPPYFFMAGIQTGHQNPLHQFQPLILPLYPLCLELSTVRTARLNAAFLSSFKPFYVQYDNAPEDEESGAFKIHFLMPGQNIPSIKGGKIVPIEWTNLDELEKIETSLMDDRGRYAFQQVLAGNQPASGDSTAWATRMMRDQGMVQFNGVLRNYAQAKAEEVRFIMALVRDVLKEDLPIARRIDPKSGKKVGVMETIYLTVDMCNAGMNIQCKLSAGKATDRIAIVEALRRGNEAGELPKRIVREEGWMLENNSEVEDEVTDERVRAALVEMLPDIILELSKADASSILADPNSMSPEEAQMMADQQAQQEMMAQQQQLAMQPPPLMLPPGQPLPGEIPGGVAEAGLQQGLDVPSLPAEDPTGVVLS
jgi:hypothetical protein